MKTTVKYDFKGFTINAKGERVASLVIKGDLTDDQILALDKLKSAGTGFMTLASAQAELEDYISPPRRGIPYNLVDGAVEVGKGEPEQLDIDTVGQIPEEGEDDRLGNEGEPDWLDDPEELTPSDDIPTYEEEANDGEPTEEESEIQSMRSEAEDGELPDEL